MSSGRVEIDDGPSVSSGRVRIDDELSIYYEASGHGAATVLLVPGWTMSTAVFERQLAFFAGSAEYRFVTYDPRAHGESTRTAGGHYYARHGRDLGALVECLELERVVLGGWSFGTLEALAYVNQFGADRLAGLIMLDGPPRAAGPDNAEDWVSYRFDDADGRDAFFTMGRLADRNETNRAFATWLLEHPTEERIAWLVDLTEKMPDTAAALLNATARFHDYREDLIALNARVPLLYVVREELGPRVSRWAARHTPSARVEAFGGHMMFWERADEFNRVLSDFLACCHE